MPFQDQKSGPPRFAWSRIVEALLIAAVAAMASTWSSYKVLAVEFENMKERQVRIEAQLEQIQRDIYRPRFSQDDKP